MENKKPDIVDVELIPPDVEITFKMNSDLHTRLQQLMVAGLPFKNQEHFQKCIEEVGKNQVTDPLAYHMQTLLYIMEKFEISAREQNLLVKKKFSFPDNKFLEEDNPTKK